MRGEDHQHNFLGTRRFVVFMAMLSVLLSGCIGKRILPAPQSPAPTPRLQTLHAGFGRAEITPPMGAGLFGYGPEGKSPRGLRQRLWAKALVLEDASGEKLALVSADLGAVSALVQRMAAERTARIGIGADRLILSATHTHAGPGNFFSLVYDEFGTTSSSSHFDPLIAEWMAEHIATAIERAAASMRPARIGWGVAPVWGLTRNRALAAYQSNQPVWKSPFAPPAGLKDSLQAVNPAWLMLRVDLQDAQGTFRPAGAFSNFAVHGTSWPASNELYDGDIQGFINRRIEQHVDSLNQRAVGARTNAVHLFANGTAGDVSPDFARNTRCPVPRRRWFIPTIAAMLTDSDFVWPRPDSTVTAACMERARNELERVGLGLAEHAIALYDRIPTTNQGVSIGRVFENVRIYRTDDVAELCRIPLAGVATPTGVEDGKTRLDGRLGMREGRRSDDADECHRPKVPFLWEGQPQIAAVRGLPWRIQAGLARIGAVTLAWLPTEITVNAGGRIRDAIAVQLRQRGLPADTVAVLSLTNGYVQYTTTPEEYALQRYEGSSTLYGPQQAAAWARLLSTMSARLPAVGAPSPAATVVPDTVWKFTEKKRTPHASQGSAQVPRAVGAQCSNGVLTAEWTDLAPGRMLRDTSVWFTIRRRSDNALLAWDDRHDVDIHAIANSRRGYRWQLHWVRAQRGDLRITFRPGQAQPTVTDVTC